MISKLSSRKPGRKQLSEMILNKILHKNVQEIPQDIENVDINIHSLYEESLIKEKVLQPEPQI